MQQERAEQEEINRHLRLEIETLRAPARIEAHRDEAAAPRGAVARRGDRARAGDAVGASRKVDRRGALTRTARQEDRWRTNTAADSGSPGAGSAQRDRDAGSPPASPIDWRDRLALAPARLRGALRAAGPSAIEARLVYLQVVAARRHDGARQPPAAADDQAAGEARRDRRSQRTRPRLQRRRRHHRRRSDRKSTIPTRSPRRCAPRSTRCSGQQRAADGRAARAAKQQFVYLARQVSPDEARRVKALDLCRACSSTRRAAATTRTRNWRRTCSATSVSTTSGSPGSSRPSTHGSAAARARCSCRPTRGGTRCRRARSGRRPPATASS